MNTKETIPRCKVNIRGESAAVVLACALGIYWGWASCHFFGTIMLPFSCSPLQDSELVHMVALVVCACMTSFLPIVVRGRFFRKFVSIAPACFCAAFGSFATIAASAFGGCALVCASIVSGVGEALMLYCICRSINPGVGVKTILILFSSALVIGGVLYFALFAVAGIAASVLSASLPLLILVLLSKNRPSRYFSSGTVSGDRVENYALASSFRQFFWKIAIGFSVFGIAFGLMRGIPFDASASFSEYYLVHEACRIVAGAVMLLVAFVAKNKYWTTSMFGIVCFACSFLLAYGFSASFVSAFINITATLGYTCFEILMWAVIFEVSSETKSPFELPYGFGRGFMQMGIAVGTIGAFFLTNGTTGLSFAPVFQTTIVVMLALMLGLFSNRNMSELWGAKKRALDDSRIKEEDVSELLADAFSLSPRECEIAILLTKGRSEPFIAESLFLSKSTVHSHIMRIYSKTGVHSRQEFLTLVEKSLVSL